MIRTLRAARAPLALLALGLLGAGCLAPAAPPPGEIVELPSNSFAVHWPAPLPLKKSTLQSLALNDDKVFAYASDNRVYWVERSNGTLASIGMAGRPNDVLYPPVTYPERVIIPSTSQLTVHDRGGRHLYNIALRASASSGAAGAGEMLFLGTDHPNGGRISAIDIRETPHGGLPVWELHSVQGWVAAPGLQHGTVYAAGRDGGVFAVRAEDREPAWPGLPRGFFQAHAPIIADVKAASDGVYVASMDSKLYCLDSVIGRIRWTYHATHPLGKGSSPVVTQDMVYVYVPRSGIAAIDKAGQNLIRKHKWVAEGAIQFLASDDRFVYLRTSDNFIIGVDKQTGKEQMRSRRNDFKVFATNDSAKDSTIYAATEQGMLYAIRPVLKPGLVGEWVLNVSPLELAAAK